MTPKRENGQGSVFYRKSDDRWCASLSLPSPTGRPRRVTRTAATERQAKVKLVELLKGAAWDEGYAAALRDPAGEPSENPYLS